MQIEKDTMKCEAVFNDERTHRYLWKRVWNKDKPLAAVIMLNPCLSDTIMMDTTTAVVVNNIARLEQFGGVMIVNLYSHLANDDAIVKAAEECSEVILAWGKGTETNKRE